MDSRPALEASLVQESVGNAHGDLNRLQELLAQQPALINVPRPHGIPLIAHANAVLAFLES